jgi:hypothetical protein
MTTTALKDTASQFLQNIQDTKSNNLWNTLVSDELQRSTTSPSLCETPTFQDFDDDILGDYKQMLHLNDLPFPFDKLDDNNVFNEDLDFTPTYIQL